MEYVGEGIGQRRNAVLGGGNQSLALGVFGGMNGPGNTRWERFKFLNQRGGWPHCGQGDPLGANRKSEGVYHLGDGFFYLFKIIERLAHPHEYDVAKGW